MLDCKGLSNRVHFLLVYRHNNPVGMLEEHKKFENHKLEPSDLPVQ